MLGAGGLTRLPELLLRVLLVGVLLLVCVMFAAKNPSPAQLPWGRSPPVEASLFHSEILKVFRLCVSFPLQHKALGLISLPLQLGPRRLVFLANAISHSY